MIFRRGIPLLLTLAVTALAQAPSASQQQTASTAQQATVQQPTLRTGTRLVVVDVVVTDKNGNPVRNLKAEDFALFENKTAQTFKLFEEHVAPSAAEAMKLPVMPKLPPGIFTNFAVAPASGPLNILLLDRLNTAQVDQMTVQQQVNDYLKTATPGMRMAVFGLTDHLILLQGFTSSPEVLKAAVNGPKSKSSPLLADAAGSGSSAQTVSDLVEQANAENGIGETEETELLAQFQRMTDSFQSQMRGKYTMDALNLLARYLSAFPGRKNLIWFSGSFPVNIMPDEQAAESPSLNNNPFSGVASLEKEFRQTTAQLSRSQVAVYPIGAKGLEGIAAMQASVDASQAGAMLRSSRGVANAISKEQGNRFSEHSTMYMMADDTGGKATVDNNGLAQALAADLQNGANYYTIAYSPTNSKLDGTFRSIEVRLREEGYKLSYRRGYFAEDTENAATVAAADAGAANGSGGPGMSKSLALAQVHGAPPPTEIIFSSRVMPLGTKTEEYPAPGNHVSRKAKGPFQRYAVDFVIDPRELNFTVGPDGNRHETIEFVTTVYTPDGEALLSTSNRIATNVIPAAYAQFQKSGVPFHQEISVPEKGEYYLRLGVNDVEQDKVGAVELAVAAVKNLPAGPQPKPAPAPREAPADGGGRMGGGRGGRRGSN